MTLTGHWITVRACVEMQYAVAESVGVRVYACVGCVESQTLAAREDGRHRLGR